MLKPPVKEIFVEQVRRDGEWVVSGTRSTAAAYPCVLGDYDVVIAPIAFVGPSWGEGSPSSKHPSRAFCCTRAARFTTKFACMDRQLCPVPDVIGTCRAADGRPHGACQYRIHLKPRAGIPSHVGGRCRPVWCGESFVHNLGRLVD
jgi:hypothetical protein